MKLVKINENSNDAKRFTPTEILEDAVKDYASGELTGSKIMIICLDDSDGNYRIYRRTRGMSGSQSRAALDAAKYLILGEHFEE